MAQVKAFCIAAEALTKKGKDDDYKRQKKIKYLVIIISIIHRPLGRDGRSVASATAGSEPQVRAAAGGWKRRGVSLMSSPPARPVCARPLGAWATRAGAACKRCGRLAVQGHAASGVGVSCVRWGHARGRPAGAGAGAGASGAPGRSSGRDNPRGGARSIPSRVPTLRPRAFPAEECVTGRSWWDRAGVHTAARVAPPAPPFNCTDHNHKGAKRKEQRAHILFLNLNAFYFCTSWVFFKVLLGTVTGF